LDFKPTYRFVLVAKLRTLMKTNKPPRDPGAASIVPNGHVLAIDIGGTLTKIAIIGPDGLVKLLDSIPTRGNADTFLDEAFKTATRLQGQSDAELTGIGIAIAAPLNSTRSAALFSANISWLEDVPILRAFEERFQLPVLLEIDSNAAALAEYYYGAGRGARRLLCLCIGTGLGGAMLVDGAIVRLTHEGIGDPGHILLSPDGPRCSAGCRGCAEALVSVPAVLERVRSALARGCNSPLGALADCLDIRQIIAAGHHGDELARQVLDETGVWLGSAIASLAAVLCPDRVVIVGGISDAGRMVLESAEKRFRSQTAEPYNTRLELCNAHLGWRAGVIGAATAVWLSRPKTL
jgi:glucokinase